MDRGGIFQPGVTPAWGEALTMRGQRQAGFRWFYLPCLLGAVGVGAASTVFPLQALLALVVVLVVAVERNNSANLRRRCTPVSKAGLLVVGTVRNNWAACVEPRGLRPKAAEKRLVLLGVGHLGRRRYKFASGRSTS